MISRRGEARRAEQSTRLTWPLVAFSPSHGMGVADWQGGRAALPGARHDQRVVVCCKSIRTANSTPTNNRGETSSLWGARRPVFFFAHHPSTHPPPFVMTPPPTPAAVAHAALCGAGRAHDSTLLPCYKSMSSSMYPPVICTTSNQPSLVWTLSPCYYCSALLCSYHHPLRKWSL